MNKKINILFILVASLFASKTAFCMESKDGNTQILDFSNEDHFAGADYEWSKNQNLKKINIHNTQVTTETLDRMGEYCPSIEELTMTNCPNIDCEKVDWSFFKKLKTLKITTIRDNAINEIGKYCKKLKKLVIMNHFLKYNKKKMEFTGKGVKWKRFKKAKTFRFFNVQIAKNTADEILKNCSSLVPVVYIDEWNFIADKAVIPNTISAT